MMSEGTWTTENADLEPASGGRLKFIIGGLVIAGILLFLVVNLIANSDAARYYITVDEYYDETARYAERDLRMSAWVVTDSIQFTQIDAANSRLEFDISDNLENPGQTMRVVVINQPVPDLLHEEMAQAVVEGSIGTDGAIYANDGGLLLKCPTRYEELEPGDTAAVVQ